MRALAILAGALLIGAAAHVAIAATGGYHGPTAPITAAIAFGLVIGAVCVGLAWRDRRFAVAGCLVLALMAGEAYAIILTAERVVSAREAEQAPIRDAEAARIALMDRLEKAEAAKEAADAVAIEKAAERHCAANCRQLLQDQIASAQAEVDAAREALATVKAPASATPLADRIGIAGWALDLVTAALASIAANGLGAALVAFGAHGRREQKPQPITEPPKVAPVSRFIAESLMPAEAATSVATLYVAYCQWSTKNGGDTLGPRDFGIELNEWVTTAGLTVDSGNGSAPQLLGVALKSKSKAQRRALGHMAKLA